MSAGRAGSNGDSRSAARRVRLTREERRAETRQHLLDAAAHVVAARGLEAASIDEITAQAGYTRGAFYSNFSSKEELFVELCEQRLVAYIDEVVPLVEAVPEDERLRHAARYVSELRPRPEALFLIELARLRSGQPAFASLIDRFVDRFTDQIDRVLQTVSTQLGNPSPQLRRRGARAFVGAILSLAFLGHLGLGDEDTAHLMLDGLKVATFGEIMPDLAEASS